MTDGRRPRSVTPQVQTLNDRRTAGGGSVGAGVERPQNRRRLRRCRRWMVSEMQASAHFVAQRRQGQDRDQRDDDDRADGQEDG